MHYRSAIPCVFLVIGSLLATAGCTGRSASKTFGTAGTIGAKGTDLDACQLCDDFHADADAASSAYGGRKLTVSGTIRSVREDRVTGRKYLELKGSEGGPGTRNVRCFFSEELQEEVAKLKPGANVKLQGACKGKQGTEVNFDVALDACKLLK